MKTIILMSKDKNLIGSWTDGTWCVALNGETIQPPKYSRRDSLDEKDFESRVEDIITRYDALIAYISAENFVWRKLDTDAQS